MIIRPIDLPATASVRTRRAADAPATANGAAQTDAIRLFGVPDAEMTPAVRDALMSLIGEVDALRRERDRLQARLRQQEQLADTDPLVEIANRRAFVRELARVVAFTDRYNMQASLLFFDLDGFKAINDRFGHAAGDAVLRHVGRILTLNVRESDVVARVGGDEFAVILSQAGREAAQSKAGSLLAALKASPCVVEGVSHTVAASVGVYTFEKGDTAELALARADEAMYAAKLSRRA